MVKPKYGASVDLNQKEIVDALNDIPGCKAIVIGFPVDVMCGYRAHNIMLEIKRPSHKPRTPTQKNFLRDWPGQVQIVETPEQAVHCVLNCYKQNR